MDWSKENGTTTPTGGDYRDAKPQILLAEQDSDTGRLKQIVQFFGSTLAVAPRVAHESVAELGLSLCLPFDGFAHWREFLYLRRRV